MAKLSKNFKKAKENLDTNKLYSIADAVKIVKEKSFVKFDESVELALKLGIDPKQAEQQMRGTFVLPHGSGKTQTILVICPDEEVEKAKKAGADFVGGADMITKIKTKKWFDYDVIVAHPKMMAEIGKIGQILGPKKLMPNPKSGTVSTNLEKTIKEIKNGKIEYRNDKYGNVHVVIGKVSFDHKKLEENCLEFLKMIKANKPQKSKGTFLKNISISSTMGPGLKISFEG